MIRERIIRLQKNDPTLTKIGPIDHTRFSIEEVKAMVDALKTNTFLTILNVSSSNLGPEVGMAFVEMLKSNTTLTHLHLGNNDFGPDVGKAFAEMLRSNKTLVNLSLLGNNFGPEGGMAFVEMLKSNTTLTHLNLSYSKLGPEVGTAFAEMLRSNKTLVNLSLLGNNFGPEGGMAFAEMLRSNTTLTTLSLGDNSFGPEVETALEKMLRDNSSLTFFYFYDSMFGRPNSKESAIRKLSNEESKNINLFMGKLRESLSEQSQRFDFESLIREFRKLSDEKKGNVRCRPEPYTAAIEVLEKIYEHLTSIYLNIIPSYPDELRKKMESVGVIEMLSKLSPQYMPPEIASAISEFLDLKSEIRLLNLLNLTRDIPAVTSRVTKLIEEKDNYDEIELWDEIKDVIIKPTTSYLCGLKGDADSVKAKTLDFLKLMHTDITNTANIGDKNPEKSCAASASSKINLQSLGGDYYKKIIDEVIKNLDEKDPKKNSGIIKIIREFSDAIIAGKNVETAYLLASGAKEVAMEELPPNEVALRDKGAERSSPLKQSPAVKSLTAPSL